MPNQNESVNKAKQILRNAGYIVENSEAVKILANLHYQICNGGWEQACFNGYVDELNTYGVKKWEKDLETKFAKSPLLKKVKKVIELIKLAMEQTVMVKVVGKKLKKVIQNTVIDVTVMVLEGELLMIGQMLGF